MHVSVDSEPILARCPRRHALDDAASMVHVDNDLQNGLGRESDRYGGDKKEERWQITDGAMKCQRFLSLSCPRRDSNPHAFKGQWILSPSRLPFRHSG